MVIFAGGGKWAELGGLGLGVHMQAQESPCPGKGVGMRNPDWRLGAGNCLSPYAPAALFCHVTLRGLKIVHLNLAF